MGRIAALAPLLAAAAAAVVLLSGDLGTDPRTPGPPPGHPSPFLGTAVLGSGGLSAAVDAYGDLIDLRLPGPAGEAQISNSSERQAAGTVPADTGVVPAAAAGDGRLLQLWHADELRQGYLPGTNVLRTEGRVSGARVSIDDAVAPGRPRLTRRITVQGRRGERVRAWLGVNLDLAGDPGGDSILPSSAGFQQSDGDRTVRCQASPQPRITSLHGGGDAVAGLGWRGTGTLRVAFTCDFGTLPAAATGAIAGAVRADRRWLGRARPLGPEAPRWARSLYGRSLLVLRALIDHRSGAAAAGARDGWSYVWPRDAATVSLALAAAGYRGEARRVASFLLDLDLDSGARFGSDLSPVSDDRPLPGDSGGWVRVAALVCGLDPGSQPVEWRGRGDYTERDDDRGAYLANAIAGGASEDEIRRLFATRSGLVRSAGDPDSGLDSAAAWAVRPFPRPPIFGEVARTLAWFADHAGPYGISPAQNWPRVEAWSAPTAWSAWGLAAIGDRHRALRLVEALRGAATPAGMLPERVGPESGIPRSTTPLAWSHAFTVLALHELYPAAGGDRASF